MSEEKQPAHIAGDVLRGGLTAVLATLGHGAEAGSGAPYASLVQAATLSDGRPVLLLSTLAEHTRNLTHDPRVSLLFDGTRDLAVPLTGPRVTVQGTLDASDDPAARARFLARHPDAAQYADFGDFSFYVMAPRSVHVVAGFGVIHWLDWADVATRLDGADAVVAGEAGAVTHMNEDHADAIAAIATAEGAPGDGWTMTGCDPDGCDLRAGGRALRIRFDLPVRTMDELRAELVRLTRAARAA